jgi:hypothetical protein
MEIERRTRPEAEESGFLTFLDPEKPANSEVHECRRDIAKIR